jgi:hypothetical protein
VKLTAKQVELLAAAATSKTGRGRYDGRVFRSLACRGLVSGMFESSRRTSRVVAVYLTDAGRAALASVSR